MNGLAVTRLVTSKADLGHTETRTEPDDGAVVDGEVLLAIERVALTTNNITYAAFGDAMQYWDFFPTNEPEFGHMPAWGLADVVASRSSGVEVGERFYGYFPIASHWRMRPERVTPRGFYDGAPHRAKLVSAYNHYVRCSADPAYAKADENYQIVLRPLFITSFLLADFLQDNAWFGARRLVVSSASSKTAYGTAYCLAEAGAAVERIGLTSAGNRAFVEQLGCYDRAVTYDALDGIAPDVPTLYVDFSGDDGLRARVHEHFGAALVYDCVVGATQNAEQRRGGALPGPRPTFFFAPAQIEKRNRDWGYAEMNRRLDAAQRAFIRRVSDPARPWLEVHEHRGFDAARALVASMHAGRIDPRAGHVLVLNAQ